MSRCAPHTYSYMNSPIEPNRIPNGEYTFKDQSAPDNVLAERPIDDVFHAVKGSGAGHWRIESEQTSPGPVNGVYTFRIGGAAHVNTRIGAALRLFTEDDRAEARAEVEALKTPVGNALPEEGQPPAPAADKKVTILIGSGNGVQAIEGTSHVTANGELRLFCKGSKSKYYELHEGSKILANVLAVRRGYGKQAELAAEFDAKAAQVPVTVPSTFEGIPDLNGEYRDENVKETIAAVFLIDGHDFGNGKEPGCMFLATDIMTEDGIVNGYFWSPDDAGLLTSESSSFYTADVYDRSGRLVQKGLTQAGGRLRDYEPGSMTFDNAWRNMSEDRATGYRQILNGV
jgi:hypothetical protein